MEIEREENIFYNLIKNETSLTEVFCNFMKYKIFRNLFIDIVNEKIKNQENRIDKSKVKFQDFNTEVALKENEEKAGRIDLQLKINEDEIYLFEIKIETFTNLTDHQPKSYLEYLKDENKNLFFILPKGYFHKKKIFDIWENKNSYNRKEIENHNIIYWEDILEQLKIQEIDKVNFFINEFCNILDFKWFYFEKIVFTKNELDLMFRNKKEEDYKMIEDVNVPVLMNKLFKVINNTKLKINYLSNEDRQNPDFYGYILNKNAYKISKEIDFDIWFGIDFELWEKKKCPISIQLANFDIEQIKSFIKNCGISFKEFKYQDESITFYIPFEEDIYKNITEELTHKINEVIGLLQNYK